MLDQQRRHQYLAAIGIPSWLPQRQLPAAAPSADWVWDFRYPAPDIPFDETSPPPSRPVPSQPRSVAPMDPALARAALNDTLALVAEPAAKKVPEKPQVKLAPKPRHAAQVPRFQLALQVMGDYLVVESLPTASQAGFTAAHQALLCNIGRFLLAAMPETLPRVVSLKWPMLASSSLDQSRSEALAAVRYKLGQLITKHDCKRLLLLGEAAMQMVLDTDEQLDAMRGAVQLPDQPQLQVIVSHSLSELLTLHDLKAVLWQDIQPFINS